MPARKKTTARKTASRKKTSTGRKSTSKSVARKSGTRKKTTARKKAVERVSTGDIPMSVLRKARKMRSQGEGWPAIKEETGYHASQLRTALRNAGLDDVIGSGRSTGRKKTTAKKTTKKAGKKTTTKKSPRAKSNKKRSGRKSADTKESHPRGKASSKKEGKKKRSPKKTKRLNKIGEDVDLTEWSDDEIIEAVEGHKVTFKQTIDAKKQKTYKVSRAKFVRTSKKHGRVIQLRTGKEGSYSIPIAWISRIG